MKAFSWGAAVAALALASSTPAVSATPLLGPMNGQAAQISQSLGSPQRPSASADTRTTAARLDVAQQHNRLLTIIVALASVACAVLLIVLRTVSTNRAAITAANEQLLYITQHDSLTELFARDHFRALLDREVADCRESGEPSAFMLIDLDRFKQVNDVYGHAVGDSLLCETAKRFRKAAGDNAVIGRLGGDEFGVFLPHAASMEQAERIAAKIIAEVGRGFQIEGKEVSIGASLGITEIGPDVPSTSLLMTNADLALYEAKNQGRGTYATYRKEMRGRLEDRAQLETDLQFALQRDEITVFYQPMFDAASSQILCYEALMRWTHPDRGSVSPSDFIPIAEENLLIDELGEWLLKEACAEAVKWPQTVKLAVNVSKLQLMNHRFFATVVEALSASGLAPHRLVLELTEAIVFELEDELQQLIQNLSDIGVSFALDDFGSGYSSLNYIDKMRFSMIKIDPEFVRSSAAGSLNSQAVVTAVVSMANSLDMVVAAEGIEAGDQADAMRALGCTCFQGYHFAKPSASVSPMPANTTSDRQVA
ncbi:putative bifunctional diguanylate cyclase/phosphodiesterase [Erythrobacter ani]|uniref:EAL domain-containing protein n=1 Tax=Erythrobacter ani TaxID=2827235 RepID=A0ABS6SPT5_9SPHN|nr:EAL domain-containing protein [Erythrobacter ani]MBV7267058.1 EAL domain-containing protein [Erythrobacter ani]